MIALPLLLTIIVFGAAPISASQIACKNAQGSTTGEYFHFDCSDLPNEDGEGCDYYQRMQWNCSQCSSCSDGWIKDGPKKAVPQKASEERSASHAPDKCREGGGKHLDHDCCAGKDDGSCADRYGKVAKGPCGHGHAYCDAHGCTKYECHPPALSTEALIAIIVCPCLLYYFVCLAVFWYLTRKAKKAAQHIPQCGHVPAPQHAVDIPSDDAAVASTFHGMGRAEMMPSQLEHFTSQQEFGELFSNINQAINATTGFRVWHLLFYPACILFWPLGGFMLMIWGIQRARCLHLVAIGTCMEPFCKRKGLTYVVLAATQRGKHGGESRPTIVRIFCPGVAVPSGEQNTVTVVGMPMYT